MVLHSGSKVTHKACLGFWDSSGAPARGNDATESNMHKSRSVLHSHGDGVGADGAFGGWNAWLGEKGALHGRSCQWPLRRGSQLKAEACGLQRWKFSNEGQPEPSTWTCWWSWDGRQRNCHAWGWVGWWERQLVSFRWSWRQRAGTQQRGDCGNQRMW